MSLDIRDTTVYFRGGWRLALYVHTASPLNPSQGGVQNYFNHHPFSYLKHGLQID